MHRFGDQSESGRVLTDASVPIFSSKSGWPTVVYLRAYIKLAVDEGHYEISTEAVDSLDSFDSIANQAEFQLSWLPDPGDVFFINNCLLLHGRAAFEDRVGAGIKRNLVRVWLGLPGRPAVEPVRQYKRPFMFKNGIGDSYYRGPGYHKSTNLQKWY
jgi:hypothetical protein